MTHLTRLYEKTDRNALPDPCNCRGYAGPDVLRMPISVVHVIWVLEGQGISVPGVGLLTMVLAVRVIGARVVSA